jgi:hypothetical protein
MTRRGELVQPPHFLHCMLHSKHVRVARAQVRWEQEEVVTYLEHHWPRLYHSSTFQVVRRVVLSDAFQWGALHLCH